MKAITIRLEPSTVESLDEEADEHGLSRSEYIRMLLDERSEYERLQREYERIRSEYERDLERIQQEKRLLLEQRDEHQELVRYVEDELAWREQPLSKRFRWWLFGRADE